METNIGQLGENKAHTKNGRRGVKTAALLLLLFIFCVPIYVAASIASFARIRSAPPADAAVVLGAAINRDKPSPVFRERINHGVELYRSGKVKCLILTGGIEAEGGPAESEVAMKYATAHGVPQGKIYIEAISKTTYQNLQQAQKIAHAHDLITLDIVSDPLHMKRAMAMADSMGLQAQASPTPTTRYRSFSSQMRFLSHETYYYMTFQVERGLGRI